MVYSSYIPELLETLRYDVELFYPRSKKNPKVWVVVPSPAFLFIFSLEVNEI